MATSVTADDRRLEIDTETEDLSSLGIAQLVAMFESEQMEVYDPQFGETREYLGIRLRPLLYAAGLQGRDLMLVCSDGYTIALNASVLEDPGLVPLLALRDADPSPGSHWRLLEHGRELVDFDPFYLVWRAESATDVDPATLPWPYQLARIRPSLNDLPGLPPASAGARVAAGYQSFAKHCLKCHSLEGTGGKLAPPIDRVDGMLATLDDGTLARLILRVNDFYPKTKMPVYQGVLTTEQVDELVSYLRWATSPPARGDATPSP